MKATENRSRCDGADGLDRSMDGRILLRSVMCPRAIVVGGILAKDPSQPKR
jgi:hypothetical protein